MQTYILRYRYIPFLCFLIIAFFSTNVYTQVTPSGSAAREAAENLKDQEEKFNLKVDAGIGGGFDSNLFREAYPLIDDFDYPAFQPSESKKAPLFDANAYVNFGYFLPKYKFWKKGKVSIAPDLAYSRVAANTEDSNTSVENYFTWGIEGNLYIKFTGETDSNGLFFLIGDRYSQTRYTNAESYIESQAGTYNLDNYNYNENVFRFGLGYIFNGLPLGFEYKLPYRSSSNTTNGENYDHKRGPQTLKIMGGMFGGSVSRAGNEKNAGNEENAEIDKFDLYNSIYTIEGIALKLTLSLWTREYSTWEARALDGTVQSNSPLLQESRKNFTIDLYFGSMIIAPVFDVKQTSGLNLRYEYYTSSDNYQGYYNYSWHKGRAAYTVQYGLFSGTAKYEYHNKSFENREVSGTSTDKRNDQFHVASLDLNFYFNRNISMMIDYSFTYSNSNEDAVYLNYNKHYAYVTVKYFLDTKF
ncbi:MAG: hypothetical protein GY754_24700 [bacterium]|nr:hypothetical protein [bacterium]